MAKLVHIVLLATLLTSVPAVIYATDAPVASDAAAGIVIPDDTTTTTTKVPDTTTSTTEPSTTSSTTASTTTITTTQASTTTTTVAPTPAPTPKPVGPPEPNHWVVKNDTKFCLIVDMAVQLNVTYVTKDGAFNNTLYDVPVNQTKAEGKCSSNLSDIAVKWDQGELALEFGMADRVYNLSTFVIFLNVAEDEFFNSAAQTLNLTVALTNFGTPQGMSYHCGRQQVFNATQMIDDKQVAAEVKISKVAWQAFHDRAADGYDLAKDCDGRDTPDIVPIAVGLALAGLVVIVVLGYLVGRRRSSNRGGYLSM